jgi:hypothetical protein
MMDIPRRFCQSSQANSEIEKYAPVKNHNFATLVSKGVLANTRGDRNVVEQTEAHRGVVFGVVTRRTNDRDGVLDLSASNG